MFADDISSALGIPADAVIVLDITTYPLTRSLDVEVQFSVDLEDTDYTDPDVLVSDLDDLIDDPTSTLYQGNVTQYIQPNSLEVVTVTLYPTSSSSSSSVQSSYSSSSSSSNSNSSYASASNSTSSVSFSASSSASSTSETESSTSSESFISSVTGSIPSAVFSSGSVLFYSRYLLILMGVGLL